MLRTPTISPELLNSRLVRGEGVVDLRVVRAARDLELAITVFAADVTDDNLAKLNAARDAFQALRGSP